MNMKVVGLLFGLALYLAAIGAHAVIIGGKDWRQLTETVLFSYDDLTGNNICNADTGVCSGTHSGILGDVNFSRWIWATTADVGELFYLLGIGPEGYFDDPSVINAAGSEWAPKAIDIDGTGPDEGRFDVTLTQAASGSHFEMNSIWGITRDTAGDYVVAPRITDEADNLNMLGLDEATTQQGLLQDSSYRYVGVWLYRVPEPSSLLLMAIGLAGLGFVRLRKRT